MSRTRRRIGAEYRYILPSTDTTVPMTDEDRLWAIRFHSDHYPNWGSPPREFVRLYKRKMNRHNDRMLRRWLNVLFTPTVAFLFCHNYFTSILCLLSYEYNYIVA